jgi:DNA polymerase
MDSITRQTQLTDLKNKIISDNACPELVSNATNLVFGSGSVDAQVVFIGEAPGKNEDLTGKPFVGQAGKFLDEMLEKIGLSRAEVYITNIVKYRPQDNRDPLPSEKVAFLPYLERELDIIEPKLIVTLGRHSMNCFFPNLYISTVHGKPQKLNGRNFLPLFHPAAALYNSSLKETLVNDFLTIPSILKTI